MLQTEWVRGLADGGAITIVNQRRIARDTEGRIYMERWFLVPKDGKVKSEMTTIQISDSSNHTLYNCFMLEPKKECVLVPYTPSSNAVFKFQGQPTGPLPDGMGEAVHEDLGTQFVAGVETTGTRDTTIYNAGLFGNDRKMTIEREYWYSPKLGFNLLSKRFRSAYWHTNIYRYQSDSIRAGPEAVRFAGRIQGRRPPRDRPASVLIAPLTPSEILAACFVKKAFGSFRLPH